MAGKFSDILGTLSQTFRIGGLARALLDASGLSASRTFTLPNVAGTVALTSDIPSLASTTEVLTGTDAAKTTTPDAIAALWEKGSDVASAGTVSFGEGGFFHVTGTTTITDIDFATAKNGRWAVVIFDDALTLTHHATTLILPSGANIVTAANDRACFVQDASDNVYCAWYQRASGAALVGGGSGDPNYVGQDTSPAPSATGTDSLAMGVAAAASNTDAIAIGQNTDASGTNSIAIGGHSTDGSSADASGTSSIAIGVLSNAIANSGIAIGDTAQAGDASGDASAIALGNAASALNLNSIAIGSTVTASNDRAIAIGEEALSSGTSAIAVGTSADASGNNSIAIGGDQTEGDSPEATGNRSIAIGHNVSATAADSIAVGEGAIASNVGQRSWSSGIFTADGDAQAIQFICRGITTNATPTNINPDGGTTNRMILPINTLWGFLIQLTVREQTTGDSKYTEIRGAIKRNGSTTTALVGAVSTDLIAADAGGTWTAAVTANDTDEALQIAVTGEASHNLHWVAVVHISEVSG